ncbi:uncharacterized protein PV06_04715 [Exophiala oligosperma]|uniref:Uncharacterized protein n=1 Tax=Exophiala oligosperma TaxID=215243 RepID=A0A0D2AUZ6_9EURO|nr:uncharacterized protein PV06_04715 [Exophiala oligosperma]KIW43631.1 hypothetical protein PV06_04715 [Exophiala oligosperma]
MCKAIRFRFLKCLELPEHARFCWKGDGLIDDIVYELCDYAKGNIPDKQPHVVGYPPNDKYYDILGIPRCSIVCEVREVDHLCAQCQRGLYHERRAGRPDPWAEAYNLIPDLQHDFTWHVAYVPWQNPFFREVNWNPVERPVPLDEPLFSPRDGTDYVHPDVGILNPNDTPSRWRSADGRVAILLDMSEDKEYRMTEWPVKLSQKTDELRAWEREQQRQNQLKTQQQQPQRPQQPQQQSRQWHPRDAANTSSSGSSSSQQSGRAAPAFNNQTRPNIQIHAHPRAELDPIFDSLCQLLLQPVPAVSSHGPSQTTAGIAPPAPTTTIQPHPPRFTGGNGFAFTPTRLPSVPGWEPESPSKRSREPSEDTDATRSSKRQKLSNTDQQSNISGDAHRQPQSSTSQPSGGAGHRPKVILRLQNPNAGTRKPSPPKVAKIRLIVTNWPRISQISDAARHNNTGIFRPGLPRLSIFIPPAPTGNIQLLPQGLPASGYVPGTDVRVGPGDGVGTRSSPDVPSVSSITTTDESSSRSSSSRRTVGARSTSSGIPSIGTGFEADDEASHVSSSSSCSRSMSISSGASPSLVSSIDDTPCPEPKPARSKPVKITLKLTLKPNGVTKEDSGGPMRPRPTPRVRRTQSPYTGPTTRARARAQQAQQGPMTRARARALEKRVGVNYRV